jgi:hypothetical protein
MNGVEKSFRRRGKLIDPKKYFYTGEEKILLLAEKR